jgi:hypothetical protein
MPIIALVATGVVIALVVFLIMQSGGDSGTSNEENQQIEADRGEGLPGQYVDLPGIYDGCYHCETGNDTASHVRASVDYTVQDELPPAGGPHWGASSCPEHVADAPPFCGPVQWGIYREPDEWEAASLVHSMEHGGVVVWYNSTDPEVIQQLESAVKDKLEDKKLVVLTPYKDIAEDTIAMTAWARRDVFPASELTEDRVKEFIDVFSRRFNPEGF